MKKEFLLGFSSRRTFLKSEQILIKTIHEVYYIKPDVLTSEGYLDVYFANTWLR